MRTLNEGWIVLVPDNHLFCVWYVVTQLFLIHLTYRLIISSFGSESESVRVLSRPTLAGGCLSQSALSSIVWGCYRFAVIAGERVKMNQTEPVARLRARYSGDCSRTKKMIHLDSQAGGTTKRPRTTGSGEILTNKTRHSHCVSCFRAPL